MKSRIERLTPLLSVLAICLTFYLCVREISRSSLARTAIECGKIGVRK